MLLTSEGIQRKLETHQQELEAQAAGIGQLLQDQQGLHDKLLKQLHQLNELQEILAAYAASLARVPRSPTLTLQASLEVAAHLGPGFCLSSGSKVWTARELLALFQQMQPLSLQMPVSLVKPGITSAGAIYEVGARGEVITEAPLFRIERPGPGSLLQKKQKKSPPSQEGN
jgi:hypothetical protein